VLFPILEQKTKLLVLLQQLKDMPILKEWKSKKNKKTFQKSLTNQLKCAIIYTERKKERIKK
jgi:hypothetical protein